MLQFKKLQISLWPMDPRGQVAVLVAGLLLAVFGGYDLATPDAPRFQTDLLVLFLATVLISWGTVPLRKPTLGASPQGICAFPPLVRPGLLRVIGLALVALGIAGGAVASSLLWVNQAEWKAALPWWYLGMLGPLAGATVIDLAYRRLVLPRPHGRGWPVALAVLLVCGLAFAARTHRLDEVPPGIFIDETNGAMDALNVLRGAPVSPFVTGWYEIPTGYVYAHAAVIAAFGPTLLGLKLPGIIMGVLTVLGVFCLGRLLFGTAAGLLAASFLAVGAWAVNMSRWGWITTVPPAAHVWAVYFLVRGARSGRATDFALAGLVLGLGMYSYLSIRLVLVACAAYLVYRAAVDRGFLRQRLAGLALFALLWALTFAPLAITYAKNPRTFLNRSSEITIQKDIERAGGSFEPVVENLRRHLLMFNVEGDRNGRHNVPGRPMLDPVMGTLFVLGVARALLLILDHRRGLLLLWIGGVLLGGILSALSEGPQGFRTQGVMPAVALLCGEVLARVGVRLAELLRTFRWPRVAAYGLPALCSVGLLSWSAWLNYRTYFVDFPAHPTVYIGFSPLETAIAKEVVAAPDPSAVYLSPNLFYFSPVQYFAAPKVVVEPGKPPASPFQQFQGPDDLPLPERGDRDATLLWGAEWAGLSDLLRPLYPNLRAEQVPARSGGLLYEKVTIPTGDLREIRGLVAEGLRPDGRSERTRVEDPIGGLSGEFEQVTWSGSLYVPRGGPRAVWAADGAAVLVAGKPGVPPMFLPEGLHSLQVTQSGAQARAGLRLHWGEQAGGGGAPIPADNLFARTPTTERGLLGTYYRGEAWDGPPLFERVDPVILFGWQEPEPVPGPFSVRWQGEIEIATAGGHTFVVNSDDGARLWLDGRVVGESMRRDSANFFEIRLDLTRGRHPIRLDYFQRGGAKSVQLRWIAPGRPPSLVPSEVLRPATP